MNEYEAHLSSYDHSHKQRLKDMRQLTRDPLAANKARKAEAKANAGSGLISIKIGGSTGEGGAGGGFKKGGFRKAGFKSAFAPAEAEEKKAVDSKMAGYSQGDNEEESDTEDEGDEGDDMYDPRYPTD